MKIQSFQISASSHHDGSSHSASWKDIANFLTVPHVEISENLSAKTNVFLEEVSRAPSPDHMMTQMIAHREAIDRNINALAARSQEPLRYLAIEMQAAFNKDEQARVDDEFHEFIDQLERCQSLLRSGMKEAGFVILGTGPSDRPELFVGKETGRIRVHVEVKKGMTSREVADRAHATIVRYKESLVASGLMAPCS